MDEDLKYFYEKTGLNIDRVSDLTRLLAVQLLTQNRNKMDPIKGKSDYAMKYFPPLYSCNDTAHVLRMNEFISDTGSDVFEANRKFRSEVIEKSKLGAHPKSLADVYQ